MIFHSGDELEIWGKCGVHKYKITLGAGGFPSLVETCRIKHMEIPEELKPVQKDIIKLLEGKIERIEGFLEGLKDRVDRINAQQTEDAEQIRIIKFHGGYIDILKRQIDAIAEGLGIKDN